MSDDFFTIPIERLLRIILNQEKAGGIFGIPNELFYRPSPRDPYRFQRYGQLLETPLGVAAGPHTQMAQNIVTAWLTGSRYIELKTVQTLDELNVSKPCIDMEDEGYNCEWSQELKLHQSYHQYLDAWILIHLLRHKFGWDGPEDPGCIFNLSVGYNMEGILKPNVQEFLDKMAGCNAEKEQKLEKLEPLYPAIKDIRIPDCISNNITLSTMHGCPPGEIEKIGNYLIRDRGYHTAIKMNPTLLGPERLRDILNHKLSFETHVPDDAFGHDLKYEDALGLIRSLRRMAGEKGVQFGLKLTNTLESVNHKDIFPTNETMMYMSGRALHPISVNVAAMLQETFNGDLDLSFSAGVDCFNVADIIACGIKPVTMCSDLLKPGGYARQIQYLEQLGAAMEAVEARNIDEFILNFGGDGNEDVKAAALTYLRRYADEVIRLPRYRKNHFPGSGISTARPLHYFDCVQAPCQTTCPAHQGIPDYMYYTASGKYREAFEVILRTNPFPSVTGMVCDHICMTACTRVNYDSPIRIRDIKRFVSQQAQQYSSEESNPNISHITSPKSSLSPKSPQQYSSPESNPNISHISSLSPKSTPKSPQQYSSEESNPNISHISSLSPKSTESPESLEPGTGLRVAIIGGGPSGLACAFFLVQSGVHVEVFEAKDKTGGMVSATIPGFRLLPEDIERDIHRIEQMGVHIHYNTKIDKETFTSLYRDFDYVYVASGASRAVRLNIEGETLPGVMDGLDFLGRVRAGEELSLGKKIAIIGGGNSAVDAARTAWRLCRDKDAEVFILYRRTKEQMPAAREEILELEAEGIQVHELTAPVKISRTENKENKENKENSLGNNLTLTCWKMKLGDRDSSGRPRPVKIEGSGFEITLDTVISAIGQQKALNFLDHAYTADAESRRLKGKTAVKNLLIGGDALRGPFNIITAIADGKKAADTICGNLGISPFEHKRRDIPLARYQQKSAHRDYGALPPKLPPNMRQNFDIVIAPLIEAEAREEASRCLMCDDVCNVCVTVCPNRANVSYTPSPQALNLQKIIPNDNSHDNSHIIREDEPFNLEQSVQVLNIADFCNQCGNCRTFCPTSGAPYIDKPKLCLSQESFLSEPNSFFIDNTNGNPYIRSRRTLDGKTTEERLIPENGHFTYENGDFSIILDKETFRVKSVHFNSPTSTEISLRHAAVMRVLLESANEFLDLP